MNELMRRLSARLWYAQLARTTGDLSIWTMMNYGYEGDDCPAFALAEEEEIQRTAFALYERMVSRVPIRGRRLLEVGCGRGGGAAFVHQRHAPASTLAIDFVPEVVALAAKRHPLPGLTFMQGDAESLPTEDAAFDVVLNIESSHCYARPARFFEQARRVLVPGGHFLCADFRPAGEIEPMKRAIEAAGFALLEADDISDAVLRALGTSRAGRLELARMLPPELGAHLSEFVALEGSQMLTTLQAGATRYCALVAEAQ